MANFSAAFGYDFYIVPLLSSSVDVSSAQSATTSTDFFDPTGALTGSSQVVYTGGDTPSLSVGGTAIGLEGDFTGTPAAIGIRLAGLTNASLQTDTSSEDIYTYDDETKGFNQAVATTKSFSISLAGVADFSDAGYQVLRLVEQNTVADSLRVKFLRVGPTGVAESVFGYGTLTGYSESNEVASIVSWDCTITGYGAYGLELVPNTP